MKTSRFTDSQIIALLKQADAGTPVSELCREHGMNSASFYKWRAKYGGMDAALMTRMKELEVENARLKKMYARRAPEGRSIARGHRKKVVSPSQRREMDCRAVKERSMSVQVGCAAFGISETCYRYQAKRSAENEEIADRLIKLTHNQRNWGFGLCFLYLRNVKGYGWNHKRVYRIYRELELNLRIKPRKRLVREQPEPLAVPQALNESWSMDFMHDQLTNWPTASVPSTLNPQPSTLNPQPSTLNPSTPPTTTSTPS